MSGENGAVLASSSGGLEASVKEKWEENSLSCGSKGERSDSVLTSK